MTSYATLNRTRAHYLGELTKIEKFVNDFNVNKTHVNELKVQRELLHKKYAAHESVIAKLIEHADSNPEEIDGDNDRFSIKYRITLSQLEQKLSSSEHTSSSNTATMEEFQDELDCFVLQLGEFEAFITSYIESQCNVAELQSRLKLLEQLHPNYTTTFNKMLPKSQPATRDSLKEGRREFENAFFRTSGWFVAEISKLTPSTTASRSINSTHTVTPKLKLPTIELLKFDGTPELWIKFRDTFKSLVHNNAELTGSIKFRYLKTSIIDKHSPINHLLESDEGYEDAWAAVLAFYNNVRRIVDAHFQSMMTTKKMSSECHDELQRIVNEFTVNTTALERLYKNDELYLALVANFVIHRLDTHTRDLWETENDNEIPMWPKLKIFLEKRRKVLSSMPAQKLTTKILTANSGSSSSAAHKQSSASKSSGRPTSVYVASNKKSTIKCQMCDDDHKLYTCKKFLQLSVSDRNENVNKWKVCSNCFGSHLLTQCTSKYRCFTCKENHHSLLHQEAAKTINQHSTCNSSRSTTSRITFLQTALVLIQDMMGEWHQLRALLDGASDAHYIKTSVAKALRLDFHSIHIEAFGLGAKRSSIINYKVTTNVANRKRENVNELDFLVIDNITGLVPHSPASIASISLPSNIELADPHFNVPGNIDILIGGQLYLQLLTDGRIKLADGPVLQNTIYGWVIGGEASQSSTVLTTRCHHTTLHDVRDSIEKFYKLEDYKNEKGFLTEEEAFCEQVFEQTHQRLPTGRFVINIPFNEKLNELANNYRQTLCQFLSNEKRLQKRPELLEKYIDFMREYENLNHMQEINISGEDPKMIANYLAHHPVEKPDSLTTAVRIVFNASAKTPSGLSLNDTQCVGPQIQSDGFTLNLRFRQHSIVIKADIAKMYRQIEVVPHQRKFQRIFWRENPQDTLKVFELKTVTYGTASASFQATRCLKQLAIEHRETLPVAAEEIDKSMYMDDFISGADSLPEAVKLAKDVDKIISSAEMKLRKFNSNCPEFLSHIAEADRESAHTDSTLTKALGNIWNSADDTLAFDVKTINSTKITKRTVLSEIAKMYDPEGLLGPVTFRLKLFMKKVWNLNTTWDEELPAVDSSEWNQIAATMTEISNIRIPRHVFISNYVTAQLHGFSDASDSGYGCAIYILSQDAYGNRSSHLICAKSRIAPNEFSSTARLELCGGLILAHMMTRVEKAFTVSFERKVCWLDSSIVLHWLKKTPSQLQTFVANRVSEIQQMSKDRFFRHVRGEQNPADLISRGLMPTDIINNSFWWHGPEFLLSDEDLWPSSMVEIDPEDLIYKREFKKIQTLSSTKTPEANPFIELVEDCSSLHKAKVKLALVMRFVYNAKIGKRNKTLRTGPRNVDDMRDAEVAIARIYQKLHFQGEFNALSNNQSVAMNSRLKNLNPQWDKKNQIIRVGGRLDNASVSEDQKHPIILPNCHFTTLIINEVHRQNFHAGQQSTLSLIRLRFWPLRAKHVIRKELHKCVKCFRARPELIKQFMGSLPAPRITPSPAFFNTGVDYAGPLSIKLSSTRNAKTGSAYIALFVCLATKAIHLEIVSALSTKAFFSAFDRFISRRGLPKTMNSDHGTNFVGASNELQELYDFIHNDSSQQAINDHLRRQEIEWKFIPPRAPEHGGLWEAGVKSMKYHLKRVTSNALLTFEELNTVVCKIEAILNSRPLTAISEDPLDLEVLTAGHFLIGRPLTAKPDRNFIDTPVNRLERWDRILQIQQHFWQRWCQDYLHQLQVRTKNYKKEIPVSVGQLVLLHIDNLPPLAWPIGRIDSIYPGKDGITRVAKIRTAKGWLERPVTKLAILPIEDDQHVPREYVHQH